MVTIGANGNKIAYGIKHFNVDTEADRLAIRTYNLTPGTTVFVIENSTYYMFNGSKKWVKITPFGSASSDHIYDGGSVDDPTEGTGTPPAGDNDNDNNNNNDGDGIYDGGDLDA